MNEYNQNMKQYNLYHLLDHEMKTKIDELSNIDPNDH